MLLVPKKSVSVLPIFHAIKIISGGSPGLVVTGGASCSEGHGFKSQRRILDGRNIFSHIFVVRIVMFG